MGKLYIAGSGSGDTSLITVKLLHILKDADVIFFDRGSNPSLLDYVGDNTECIYVGSDQIEERYLKESVYQQILTFVQDDKLVVRLKNGHPFLFENGFDEVAWLRSQHADLEVEVLDGLPSAIGVPTHLGIPLTTDDQGAVHILSGEAEHNYDLLAQLGGTIVFTQVIERIHVVVQNLLDSGMDARTPVVIAENGTLVQQRVIYGQLATILDKLLAIPVRPAETLVIGANVQRGRNVFLPQVQIFGSEQKTSEIRNLLVGAYAVDQHTVLTFVPLPLRVELSDYDLIIVHNEIVARHLLKMVPTPVLAQLKFATVSKRVEAVLSEVNVTVAYKDATLSELLSTLQEQEHTGRALLLTADRKVAEHRQVIQNLNTVIDVEPLYATKSNFVNMAEIEFQKSAALIFLSPDAVLYFDEQVAELPYYEQILGKQVIAGDTMTATALRTIGFRFIQTAAITECNGIKDELNKLLAID